jgi:hypothetical protein
VQDAEDQGRIGRVVDGAPFPGMAACRKPPADDAGNDQQHNNVRSNGALGHIKGAVLRKKRDKGIEDMHMLRG